MHCSVRAERRCLAHQRGAAAIHAAHAVGVVRDHGDDAGRQLLISLPRRQRHARQERHHQVCRLRRLAAVRAWRAGGGVL